MDVVEILQPLQIGIPFGLFTKSSSQIYCTDLLGRVERTRVYKEDRLRDDEWGSPSSTGPGFLPQRGFLSQEDRPGVKNKRGNRKRA